MKSSRLISLIMLLQQRPRSSAAALAQALEVSTRTLLRDIDMLSAAGVPVWATRGRTGGFEIDPAWGARIAGLTEPEAQALMIAGMPNAAAQLGLGTAAVYGRLKVLSSLPKNLRAQAERYSARLHIDPGDWYRADEDPQHLRTIAQAVWDDQTINVRYKSWRAQSEVSLEPLGLVLKAGVWYVLATKARGGEARIYRVANITRIEVTGQVFVRPAEFDLAATWTEKVTQFERELLRVRARVSVSDVGLERMRNMRMPIVLVADLRNASGWTEVEVMLESIEVGARQLLALGAELCVIAPLELRTALARVSKDVAALYM
jgi:predicted DNA-binding transcriptional regulator YafY